MPSERRPSHVADLLLKGNLVCSPTTVQAFHFKLDQARRRCDPYLVFCLQAAVQHSDQMPSLSLSDRIAHLLGSTAFLRREEAPTLLLICPQLTLFLFFYFHHGRGPFPFNSHDHIGIVTTDVPIENTAMKQPCVVYVTFLVKIIFLKPY